MSRLVALRDGMETAHLPFNGTFENGKAINLDLVITMDRVEKQCFRKDHNVDRNARPGYASDGPETLVGIHFMLVGDVHLDWVFHEELRQFRDDLFKDLLNNSYSNK